MPLAACPRCERLGREQLATLLTIVAAAGERAWRVRSVAAAWAEIIKQVHTGYFGLQPGIAWGCSLGMHGAAAWGYMGLQPGDARGCNLGTHGVNYTRRFSCQVRSNPRFAKLLQRGLCRQCMPAPPLHAPPPHLYGWPDGSGLSLGCQGRGGRWEGGGGGGGLTESRPLAWRTDGRAIPTQSRRNPDATSRRDLLSRPLVAQARPDLPQERARHQAQSRAGT